jgi:hypothetical protein
VRREKALDFGGCKFRPESQHGYRFRDGKGGTNLALNPKPAFGFTSAANSELLPQPKPRAMREHFVVPAIRSRDVASADWPDIRRFEHFL